MMQDERMSNTKDDLLSDADHAGVVWDIPLRVFHWGLVAATIGSVITSKIGIMFWHEKFGLTILGLIGFRVIWGFVGSHHARFRNFMVSPSAVLRYIKARVQGDKTYHPGHAPTGAYATILILAVFSTMALLGTMANDDILYEGPLATYVGAFTDDARRYHHLMENVIFGVIILHLSAMVMYRIALKINLIPAMVHGGRDKAVQPPSQTVQVMGVMLMITMVALSQSLGLLGDRFY